MKTYQQHVVLHFKDGRGPDLAHGVDTISTGILGDYLYDESQPWGDENVGDPGWDKGLWKDEYRKEPPQYGIFWQESSTRGFLWFPLPHGCASFRDYEGLVYSITHPRYREFQVWLHPLIFLARDAVPVPGVTELSRDYVRTLRSAEISLGVYSSEGLAMKGAEEKVRALLGDRS